MAGMAGVFRGGRSAVLVGMAFLKGAAKKKRGERGRLFWGTVQVCENPRVNPNVFFSHAFLDSCGHHNSSFNSILD